MQKMSSNFLRYNLVLLPMVIGCLFSTLSSSSAQQTINKPEDAIKMDPADIFFIGWQTVNSAEKLEASGKLPEALVKYKQAAKYFDSIYRFHNDWKTTMVETRIKKTESTIKELQSRISSGQTAEEKNSPDPIEAGIAEINPAPTEAPSLAQVNLLKELEALKKENAKNIAELNQLRKEKSSNQSNNSTTSMLEDRLNLTIDSKNKEIDSLRKILARSPVQQDLDKLRAQKEARDAEILILSHAVKESNLKLKQATLLTETQQQTLAQAEKDKNRIQADMAEQQKGNNRVIDKLREDFKVLTTLLENTRQELGQSRAEQESLKAQLAQSESIISELREDAVKLRAEHNNLLALINPNKSDSTKQLISENMRLGSELSQANARFELLEKNNFTTQDELRQAKADLALAKLSIQDYKDRYQQNLRSRQQIESQLAEAKKMLSQKESAPAVTDTNSEEIETLKSTVKRLMTAQERRRSAERVLWENYQDSGQTIDGMAEAFQDIRQMDVELSPEEKELIEVRNADLVFQNPQRVPRSHALKHGNALQEQLNIYKPLVTHAFSAKRYEAARQLLEQMDENFPGNLFVLCSRGIVELRTKNYDDASELFQEAITMNEESYYVHYMLGVTEYKKGNIEEARKSFEKSLTIKETNASTHIYLGSIAGAQHRYEKAEEHFLSAANLEPTNANAYYNLSALYVEKKNKREAQNYYQKALENGKQPNIEHQKRLDQLKD